MSSLSRRRDRVAVSHPPPMRMSFTRTVKLFVVGAASAATIVFTASRVKPVFLDGTVVGHLVVPPATREEKAMLLAPWSRLSFDDALETPVFLRDRSAFAVDLMGTG